MILAAEVYDQVCREIAAITGVPCASIPPGKPRSCRDCPVAKAIKRDTGAAYVHVSSATIWSGFDSSNSRPTHLPPESAIGALVRAIDSPDALEYREVTIVREESAVRS